MSNISTAAADGKLSRLVNEAENFHEVTSQEVVYMRAIMTAIGALANEPRQQKAIIDLAKLGEWVADNIDGSFSYFQSQVSASREVH